MKKESKNMMLRIPKSDWEKLKTIRRDIYKDMLQRIYALIHETAEGN